MTSARVSTKHWQAEPFADIGPLGYSHYQKSRDANRPGQGGALILHRDGLFVDVYECAKSIEI